MALSLAKFPVSGIAFEEGTRVVSTAVSTVPLPTGRVLAHRQATAVIDVDGGQLPSDR